MSTREDLGVRAVWALEGRFRLVRQDIGPDARLAAKGMVFETESYEAEGFGHLCVMRMKAMAGLMKMETVVFACSAKDVPLFNLDWVYAMGKETQMAELYDTQLAPYPEERLAAFAAIKEKSADLKDRETSPHWYDGILYPCSYDKTGKKIGARLSADACSYMDEYLRQMTAAPACDTAAKQEKIREFAQTLFSQGGPAVDQMAKLFGRETAGRVILRHMYGVKE